MSIIVAIGFLVGALSNLGTISDAFFPNEKPLYLNLSATKSNEKWISIKKDNNRNIDSVAFWMEQHNPNDEAIEVQIVSGSIQLKIYGLEASNMDKMVLPAQAPITLGPTQKHIATAHILGITSRRNKLHPLDTLMDGKGYFVVDTKVRYRRIKSKNWHTMEIKYNLNTNGWHLISRKTLE